MMKVQDVLLKAMARKITWWAAAEILGAGRSDGTPAFAIDRVDLPIVGFHRSVGDLTAAQPSISQERCRHDL